jgi:hypothetical protein
VPSGEPAIRERDFRFYQIERNVIGNIEYPFNRAQRLELSAGFQSIDFAGEVETRIFSEIDGRLLAEGTQPLPEDSIPTINLGIASAALVYDNSYFGGTSPLLGQRYRLEASPVIGDIEFVGVLADYRRYVRVAPVTLAGRVLHYARYGADGDHPQLADLFLGYPSLVRGYNDASFTVAEEPEFNRLFGSRLGVANLELRLPLLGGLGLIPSGAFPPIEIAGFFDAGVAWRKDEPAPFQSGAREAVTSHGVALRVNLFGFAVGELDFVHPNDRPLKGWYWQFSLQPGF